MDEAVALLDTDKAELEHAEIQRGKHSIYANVLSLFGFFVFCFLFLVLFYFILFYFWCSFMTSIMLFIIARFVGKAKIIMGVGFGFMAFFGLVMCLGAQMSSTGSGSFSSFTPSKSWVIH